MHARHICRALEAHYANIILHNRHSSCVSKRKIRGSSPGIRGLVSALCVWLAVFGHCFPTVARVAEPSDGPIWLAQLQDTPAASAALPSKTDTLTQIITTRQALQEELGLRNDELKQAETEEQQAAVRKKIQELTARVQDLDGDFESLATGVDVSQFSTTSTEGFDWQSELQELLRPMIEELKKLTARPRELERLRNQVLSYQQQITLTEEAIRNIQKNLDNTDSAAVKEKLTDLLTSWQQRYDELQSRLAAVQQQLTDKEQTRESIITSLSLAFRQFFKSRGLNLILAILAFLGVFFILRYAQRIIYRKTQIGKFGQHRSFFLRLTGLAYYVFTFLASVSAFMMALYLSGDWVLLGLALVFLFGIAWTGKQTLPHFWEQAKMLLNLSTVREGERVLYQGLPWRVLALNFYTKLHNPELKGGLLRLPLSELIGLQTRPFHKDEPWFPTREGDWVELSDGSIGAVTLQTPEQVVIETPGGSSKTYPTQVFLQSNPVNYSINNFGIFITFGLDYEHQAEIVRTIPDTLHAFLTTALQQEEYGADVIELVVQFKEASASSLDLLIVAKFPGQWATSYLAISRALQRMIVDACNTYDWEIPFMQITLHQAATGTSPAVPDAPIAR